MTLSHSRSMIVEADEVEYCFKTIVVGDSGCGKTSVVRRYVDGMFYDQYQASIGLHFAQKSITYDGNKVVKLQLWDIAGQDRFREMTHVYYRKASGGVVVCDVTRPKTVEGAKLWKQDIDSKLKGIPIILLVNKSDLLTDAKLIQELSKQMDAFASECGFVGWWFTSAKDDTNVTAAMEKMGRILLSEAPQESNSPSLVNRVQLVTETDEKKGPCTC